MQMNIPILSIYMPKCINFKNPKICPSDSWFFLPIFSLSSIFSVLSLQFKQDQFYLKGNIHVYNFHEEKFLKFCYFRVQILVEKLRDNLSSFDF